MNIKSILQTWLITSTILWSCMSKEGNNVSISKNSPKKTSFRHQKSIEIANILPQDSLIKLNIKDLQSSKDPIDKALFHHIKNNYTGLWTMLWSTDAWEILHTYNPHISGKNPLWSNIKHIDSLIIPRISPSLQWFFDTNIDSFLAKHDTLRELTWDNKHVIINTKNDKWMYCTWVYINWQLRYAYAISPGVNGEDRDKQWTKFRRFSPKWSYIITRADATKKSQANDFMAFYLWFYDPRGLWLHGSQRVDGKITNKDGSISFNEKWQSHGCIRWVHIYRYLTFKDIKPLFDDRQNGVWDPIAVINYWPTYETEKEDARWYLKNRKWLDNAWKEDSNIKPVISAQHIGKKNKTDTIGFAEFAYLYSLDKTWKDLYDTLENSSIKQLLTQSIPSWPGKQVFKK